MQFIRQHGQADLLRQMFPEIAGDAVDGALLLPVPFPGGLPLEQGDLQVVDTSTELLVVHRLENIVGDLQPQRLPAIGEVIIAGYNDKGGVRMLDAAELDDLQPVHDGDVDVHDGDVRGQRVDLRQGLHAVGRFAHHLAAVGLPVEEALKALSDHDLIVYQKYAQLFHDASSSGGSRIWAVAPPSSCSVYQSPNVRLHKSLIRFCTLRMPMLLPVRLGACLA